MAPKKNAVRSKKSKAKTSPEKKVSREKRYRPLGLKKGRSKPSKFEPEIRIYDTPETLVQETAHQVMQIAREAVNARGRFVAALSGGTTPKGLFQQLTEEPYYSLKDSLGQDFFLLRG